MGSSVNWGLSFGTLPPNETFVAYAERVQERPACKTAKSIDSELSKRMKK